MNFLSLQVNSNDNNKLDKTITIHNFWKCLIVGGIKFGLEKLIVKVREQYKIYTGLICLNVLNYMYIDIIKVPVKLMVVYVIFCLF